MKDKKQNNPLPILELGINGIAIGLAELHHLIERSTLNEHLPSLIIKVP
jgi:hypothetical protein